MVVTSCFNHASSPLSDTTRDVGRFRGGNQDGVDAMTDRRPLGLEKRRVLGDIGQDRVADRVI
jgi:hypothetical protein